LAAYAILKIILRVLLIGTVKPELTKIEPKVVLFCPKCGATVGFYFVEEDPGPHGVRICCDVCEQDVVYGCGEPNLFNHPDNVVEFKRRQP
jgi:hypothetical protein